MVRRHACLQGIRLCYGIMRVVSGDLSWRDIVALMMMYHDSGRGCGMLLRVIMFLLAAFFVFYDILVQVSPGVLTKQIMAELNIGAAGLGVLSGVYFWTYCAMQIPAGLLYDRLRVRQLLFFSIFVTAASVAVFANVYEYIWSGVARLLMGVGSAFAFIGAARVAADIFSARAFPVLVGVIYVLASLGALFAQTLLVWLDIQFGWRHSLNGLAVIGVILAILCWLVIRYKQKKSTDVHQYDNSVRNSLLAVIRHRQSWVIALISLCTWGPMTVFASLWGVPFLMRAYGFAKPHAGGLIAAVWLGLALMSPVLGWLSNLLQNRRVPLIACSIIGLIVSTLIVFDLHMTTWALAALLFLLGAACAAQPLTYTLAKETHDKKNTAVALAFNNMSALFSGVLLQPLSGLLISLDWQHRFEHGARIYSAMNYQTGLVILPILFLVSLFIASMCIKETM